MVRSKAGARAEMDMTKTHRKVLLHRARSKLSPTLDWCIGTSGGVFADGRQARRRIGVEWISRIRGEAI
jgi:hypothetical protein